jgi:DNA ligase (NAD+)
MSVDRIKELISILNKASDAYYKYDNPIMSDKNYDDLYDELEQLEKETGIILNNSPTQHVGGEVLPELKKVEHTKPMLSANKTKSISEIKKFVSKKLCVMSWKEDGLTIVLRYKNGVFTQAITRGQGGLIGEDVTHTVKMCSDIPMEIPYCVDIQVRGECLISYEEFERINKNLSEPYKNPRNLASGTVRQLDSSIAKERKLTFKAFELDQEDVLSAKNEKEQLMTVKESFDYLEKCGFNVVEHVFVNKDNVEEMIKTFDPKNYGLPVDGLIFKYNDVNYGHSLGKTSKFPLDMIALKWADDVYDTELCDIEWTIGKTGSLCPTAIFNPIEIDGTIVERASLHNVSVLKNILGEKPWVSQKIGVYKSNMIIPQLDYGETFNENVDISNILTIPTTCPICGEPTKIVKDNDSEVLMCTNDNCSGKLLGKLCHAVSKNALNIDGLSEATIQKFIDLGWLSSIRDIYYLHLHKMNIYKLDGFGRKSVDKLLDSIEDSRNTDLVRYIYAQSIPLIGHTASKAISKMCDGDLNTFVQHMSKDANAFGKIDDIGSERIKSLKKWWNVNYLEFVDTATIFTFKKKEPVNVSGTDLTGKVFVITGSLTQFRNRDEMKERIESLGGKVSESVSAKTTALINNDIESTSSKNKKAKQLNIPILTENMFIEEYLQ